MEIEEVLKKWRERSKNIQNCHYDAATTLKTGHYATGIPLVILSAIAASNILTDAEVLTRFAPYSKLTSSAIGLLVTVLAAAQAFLGFDKRAELHYKAGVKYGAIKREIEITESWDEKKLSELNHQWNSLTEESPIIPMRIWRCNEKKKEAKPDSTYQSIQSAPTHAGGVVISRDDNKIRYLVVQTKAEPREWVLPKGHIEPGESMEQAARREVLEETGVETAVRDVLDTIEFRTSKGQVKARFFLLEVVPPGEGTPREVRGKKWLSFEEAMNALSFKEAQRLVLQAETIVRQTMCRDEKADATCEVRGVSGARRT